MTKLLLSSAFCTICILPNAHVFGNDLPVTSGGTATGNYIPKFTTGTNIEQTATPLFESGTNIGIGTTTPIFKLDVNGATRIGPTSGSSLYVGGKVGIGGPFGGTFTPTQMLEVYHDDVHGGMVLNRHNDNTAKSEIKFSQHGIEKWAIGNDISSNGGQNFFIWDNKNTATRLFIDEIGGVATNPVVTGDWGYGLSCKISGGTSTNRNRTKAIAVIDNTGVDQFIVWGDGLVHAREIKVTIGTFAHSDHVFADDHDLMPRENLKAYLKKNRHLPGVPSDADVEKNNGINLGEMAEVNLAKTEELYLYLLQMSDEIKQLKQEIEELKQK